MSNSYGNCRLWEPALMDLLYAVCTSPEKHKLRPCIPLSSNAEKTFKDICVAQMEALKVHVILLWDSCSKSLLQADFEEVEIQGIKVLMQTEIKKIGKYPLMWSSSSGWKWQGSLGLASTMKKVHVCNFIVTETSFCTVEYIWHVTHQTQSRPEPHCNFKNSLLALLMLKKESFLLLHPRGSLLLVK